MAAKRTPKPQTRQAARKPKVDLSEKLATLPEDGREGLLAGAEQLLHSLVTAPRVPAGMELPEDSDSVPADVAELFEQFLVDLRAGVEKARH